MKKQEVMRKFNAAERASVRACKLRAWSRHAGAERASVTSSRRPGFLLPECHPRLLPAQQNPGRRCARYRSLPSAPAWSKKTSTCGHLAPMTFKYNNAAIARLIALVAMPAHARRCPLLRWVDASVLFSCRSATTPSTMLATPKMNSTPNSIRLNVPSTTDAIAYGFCRFSHAVYAWARALSCSDSLPKMAIAPAS